MKLGPRIKRVLFLGRCFARRIFRGRAIGVPKNIQRIIVVPTGKLGDVVCNTPVFAAIRKHLPETRIFVAGNSKLHKALLSDSGLVDEYIDLDGEGAVDRIKKVGADVAVVTGPSYTYVAMLFVAGIPLVVAPTVTGGYSPSETRLYRILKRWVKIFPYHIEAYAPRERLRALEPIGISETDTTKKLGFSAAARQRVEHFFAENTIDPMQNFIVGISPSVGNKIKEWPEDRFARIADHMVEKYKATVILLGSRGDIEKINQTRALSTHPAQVLVATEFTVDELKALVSRLGLFISVDTGPIYIAEAFDVPTIDIVGPVDERVQPPQGPKHRNVVPPGRTRAELSILNARSYDVERAMDQVLSTTVDMVIREIDALMTRIS
jgi:ADP-heptose:LPS heptosyltransferase